MGVLKLRRLFHQLGGRSASNGMRSRSTEDNTGQTECGLGPARLRRQLPLKTDSARGAYTCGAARPSRMSALYVHMRSCTPSANERAALTHAELHASANECAGLPSRAQSQETHHKPSVLPRAYSKYICLRKPPAANMRSVSGRHWRARGLGVRLRRTSVSTSSSAQGV